MRYHFRFSTEHQPRSKKGRQIVRRANSLREAGEEPFWLEVTPDEEEAMYQEVVDASRMLRYMIGWRFDGALRAIAARRLMLVEEDAA